LNQASKPILLNGTSLVNNHRHIARPVQLC
jgi:hypothetical protein